jgi:hypothetical protein
VTLLKHYIDKIDEHNSAGNLFQKMPTIHFNHRAGDGDLRLLKSRGKRVITLDIGPFHAKEKIFQDNTGNIYRSERLRELTPARCTYGYDVLVHVGYALFLQCRNEKRIVEELRKKNVSISRRQIGYLGRKFIAYLAIAHQESGQRLKQAMATRGGYILHIDGTCEADSPHLFTGIDGIAQIVLDNIKMPSEKAETIGPFLRRIKRQYGDPIALVHDMGKGILSAVKTVFKDTPDFICHFHFLRDIGKDLFEKEYGVIRNRLRKHKIRSLLRKKLKDFEKIVRDDSVFYLSSGIETGRIDPDVMGKLSAPVAYAMIHWALDLSGLDGYGFPFDCPHVVFYQRLKTLHDIVNHELIKNSLLSKIWKPLTRVIEDTQLKQAATKMQKRMKTFKKLREALNIAVPKGKSGLNDDGPESGIKRIEEKVKRFRSEIEPDQDLKKMADQIDKYWDKLFADPITVNAPTGRIAIQPQRTNNLLERFFRDLKRVNRKRSGMKCLTRTLKYILSDTPLVKNLNNPEYVEILLDGCKTLEERFAKIDSNMVIKKLKAEQEKHRMNPKMKKLIQLPDLPERLTMLLSTQQA